MVREALPGGDFTRARDPLPTLLFEAKTILMGQIAKAEESALSGDGDNPTTNVSPTVEETTPNSQVTDTDEREQTRAAEKEILDVYKTDPDLLSSDDEETTTPAMTTLTSMIPTKRQSAKDIMTPTTINENGIMMATTANANVTETELAALVDQEMVKAENITTHP